MSKSDVTNHINEVRRISAGSILKGLMELAPQAVEFKADLLKDRTAPDYLRLANANDILDRTLPKPTQSVSLNANVVQANMSSRELAELVRQRLENLGVTGL